MLTSNFKDVEKAAIKNTFGNFRVKIQTHNHNRLSGCFRDVVFLREEGKLNVDINYYDPELNSMLLVSCAIMFNNTTAFDQIINHPDFDVSKLSGKFESIRTAVRSGNIFYVQKLLEKGADPKAYTSSSLIEDTMIFLSEYAIVEQSLWSTTDSGYKNADPLLKEEMQRFFHRRGKYENPEQAFEFPGINGPLHVYCEGNTDIIGLLLSKGAPINLPSRGTDCTPLTFVENPEKYGEHIKVTGTGNKYIKYLGYNKERDALDYEVTLFDRRPADVAKSVKIILHYHMGFMRTMLKHAETRLTPSISQSSKSFQLDVQQRLSAVEAQTIHLMTGKNQRAEWEEWISQPALVNLKDFYETIVARLNSFFTSCEAIAGGRVPVKEGYGSMIEGSFHVLSKLSHMVPFGGAPLALTLDLSGKAIAKGAEKINEEKQLNTARGIAKISTQEGFRKKINKLARFLTIAFSDPLLKLKTAEQVKKERNILSKGVDLAKELVFLAQSISPAEMEAMVTTASIMDVFLNENIKPFLEQQGFVSFFVTELLTKGPSPYVKQFFQDIYAKIGGVPVQTTDGSTQKWHPEDMFRLSGIRTEGGLDGEFYTHDGTSNPKCGWRLAPKDCLTGLVLSGKIKRIEVPDRHSLPIDALLTLTLPLTTERPLPVNPMMSPTSLALPVIATTSTKTAEPVMFSEAGNRASIIDGGSAPTDHHGPKGDSPPKGKNDLLSKLKLSFAVGGGQKVTLP